MVSAPQPPADRIESFRGMCTLLTAHEEAAYPGVLVVRPGPLWRQAVIVPEAGQTVVARGGEKAYAYTPRDGVSAAGFELRRGDRATILRKGLEGALAEWRIERASLS
jgi:hypothetical protein